MNLAFVLGTWEIVAIVVVGVLLFGSRLPSIARSMGKSVVEFKKGVKDVKDDLDTSVNADDKADDKHEPKKLEKSEAREIPAQKVEHDEKVVS